MTNRRNNGYARYHASTPSSEYWIFVFGMGIKNSVLRLTQLSVFLFSFSGNGYAIPMLAGPVHGDAKSHDLIFASAASTNKSESDELQAFALALRRNFESFSIGALLGKHSGPFDFLQGFYLHFGFSGQDGGLEKFITWENLDPHNDKVIPSNLVGFEEDDFVIAEFFATLGIDIADWHMIAETSHMPSYHEAVSSPDSPGISKMGQRKECLQRQREFSRKSEVHDNDCFEAGGWGGFNNNVGRSRISAIVNGSAGPNFRNNPAGNGPGGGAGGGGSGGTSPGTSTGGGNGDNGHGSGGSAPDTGGDPGTGTGGGEVGGGSSEVRPVPEPGTLILLLLGLAGVYYTRSRRG